MVERRGPHEGIVQPDNQQVKASVEIFVPVARKFTLNYHGEEEPSGQEYTIALDVLQDADLPGSALDLPLRMIMGSGDYTDLIDRCMEVIKAGYIAAKGELVIDHQDGAGESPGVSASTWWTSTGLTPWNQCREIEEVATLDLRAINFWTATPFPRSR